MNATPLTDSVEKACRKFDGNDYWPGKMSGHARTMETQLRKLLDAVKRTVNLDDCGHADGVSLILVDAVKNADEVLNASAPRSNDKLSHGGDNEQ